MQHSSLYWTTDQCQWHLRLWQLPEGGVDGQVWQQQAGPAHRRSRTDSERQRPGRRIAAAALEHADLAGTEQQAQRRRRWVVGMAGIAKGEAQALASLGSDLQAPQRPIVGLGRPPQHRATGSRAQALLHCPQSLTWCGMDDLQLRQRHASPCPGRGMRSIRRRDQHHSRTGPGQPRQRRPDQRHLAYAIGWQQDLRQGVGRPAAGRKCGIQGVMSGGLGSHLRHAHRLAAPDPACVDWTDQSSIDTQSPLCA